MRQCDKEHIIRREATEEATLKAHKDDVLKMIRFAHKHSIPDESTRADIASFNLSPDVVDSLFSQIEKEEKAKKEL